MTRANKNNHHQPDKPKPAAIEPGLENFEELVNRLKQLPPEERAQFADFYNKVSATGDWASAEVARQTREWAVKLQTEAAEQEQEQPEEEEEPLDDSGNLMVMSHAVYQSLREALALNNFQPTEDNPWPTAVLKERGGATGQAQLKPAILDGNDVSLISPDEVDRLAQIMWRQQKELSDLDADALDLLSHIWLQQARTPNDKAVAEVDQFLSLRGLEQKHRGNAIRSGYDSEQRATMLQVLSHIQNIWLNVGEVEVYTNSTEDTDDSRDRKSRPTPRGKTVKKAIQSRAFVITDRIGQMKLDGNLDVERFIFQPGHLFSQFLFGPGRQTALLSAKAVQYDPYRQKWEKRLARYLSWQWRIKARSGDYSRPYKVATLLEAIGEELNSRRPAVTRERLEKALDTLQTDGVIAAWHYQRWDEQRVNHKGWGMDWLNATALIEPPEIIREKYASLERFKDRPAPVNRLPHATDKATTSPGQPEILAASPLPETSIEQLIDDFRLKRLSLSVSQSVAARQLGVTQGYLSQLERHQLKPAPDLQKRIQQWLQHGR